MGDEGKTALEPAADRVLGRRAPAWAQELAGAYVSGSASVFLLHGNIHDLVPFYGPAGGPPEHFARLEDYLAAQLFGRRDVIIQYDRGSGVTFLAPGPPGDAAAGDRRRAMRLDWNRTLAAVDMVHGTSYSTTPTKDPKVVLELLDRYLLHKLLEGAGEEGAGRKSVAVLIRYAETIAPAADAAWLAGEVGGSLIKLLNWANDPAIRGADVTICLLCEALPELNRRLVENPFVAKVEIPLPGEAVRRELVEKRFAEAGPGATLDGLDAATLAREANGLTLVGLSQVVDRRLRGAPQPAAGPGLGYLRRAKKELIEKQCLGLVEFVAPRHDLDMLVAQPAVKERLAEDARLIREGRREAIPMGYLLCGMLGTGKTFASTCFAGTIGIPALVFANLREKWVGSSEGNLQKVLSVVKALGPVVVVVDEADAALGRRSAEGDSGTSSRMFAMISSLMSDTDYRGQVIWMLLTCRPDLLPVDLKRQGRCEVHIPLFPPASEEERREMFLTMAKKNGVAVEVDDLPPIPAGLSGADIESLVVQSRRRALIRGLDQPTPEIVAETVGRFITPGYTLQKELQELVAVRESTDLAFLPEAHRARRTDPEQAAALERRIQELTYLVGER